mmetsp:Transcript_7234/g.15481  ORF Transcript_7234/g.15481 Transcript_7234/m.15481 type:complete len:644 (-) Transcript_7234:39-1970(-)
MDRLQPGLHFPPRSDSSDERLDDGSSTLPASPCARQVTSAASLNLNRGNLDLLLLRERTECNKHLAGPVVQDLARLRQAPESPAVYQLHEDCGLRLGNTPHNFARQRHTPPFLNHCGRTLPCRQRLARPLPPEHTLDSSRSRNPLRAHPLAESTPFPEPGQPPKAAQRGVRGDAGAAGAPDPLQADNEEADGAHNALEPTQPDLSLDNQRRRVAPVQRPPGLPPPAVRLDGHHSLPPRPGPQQVPALPRVRRNQDLGLVLPSDNQPPRPRAPPVRLQERCRGPHEPHTAPSQDPLRERGEPVGRVPTAANDPRAESRAHDGGLDAHDGRELGLALGDSDAGADGGLDLAHCAELVSVPQHGLVHPPPALNLQRSFAARQELVEPERRLRLWRHQERTECVLNQPRRRVHARQPLATDSPPDGLLDAHDIHRTQHLEGTALLDHAGEGLELGDGEVQLAAQCAPAHPHTHKRLDLRRRHVPQPLLSHLPKPPAPRLVHERPVPQALHIRHSPALPEETLDRHWTPLHDENHAPGGHVRSDHLGNFLRGHLALVQALVAEVAQGDGCDAGGGGVHGQALGAGAAAPHQPAQAGLQHLHLAVLLAGGEAAPDGLQLHSSQLLPRQQRHQQPASGVLLDADRGGHLP